MLLMIIEQGSYSEIKTCLMSNVTMVACVNCGDKSVAYADSDQDWHWCVNCTTVVTPPAGMNNNQRTYPTVVLHWTIENDARISKEFSRRHNPQKAP
jgi:ribosomal protein S27E